MAETHCIGFTKQALRTKIWITPVKVAKFLYMMWFKAPRIVLWVVESTTTLGRAPPYLIRLLVIEFTCSVLSFLRAEFLYLSLFLSHGFSSIYDLTFSYQT
jgi:predicted Kef-type K+ transport protein